MRISIVSVCLNAERHIGQMLETVSAQTWHDVEHIVIDGGSSDNTLGIVRDAANRNQNLHWISEPDNGISDAMNKGLELATGEVVGFLHADDYYPDNEVLGRVVRAFENNPETEWLSGGIHHVDGGGRIIRVLPVRRWSFRRLLRGNILFHPATFIRRSVFKTVGGFDTTLRFAMDYDLWLRVGARSTPYLLDRTLACFRIHDDSLSVRQVDDAFREEFGVRCRYLQGKPVQRILHRCYFGLKFLPNRLSVR
ncbi:glycosyltransferase family 2 protein [Geobacter sp. AOG1]|uniref:glycosyltransferase family 2 protein n=1 Tax=Geobacter sp. AOG1 TaxID=1566346 RepID=UPI001CC50D71|nr:glycosyltransferase family 2 protein [Geobacter sp. AOG1]GFE58470.1 hypothetical protein AOG1_23500 [Geobacter sp. AOG1]